MVLDAQETSQETMFLVLELLSSAANWVKIISYSTSTFMHNVVEWN